jgi:two-component system cell cycle sensor histidine kinase/response regulator CckA
MTLALPMTDFNRAELFQTLFEENGDALFLFDPDSEALLDVNPTVQRLTGLTRKELLQSPVSYFFRSEVQGRLGALRHACRKTGPFHSMEGFLLRTHQSGLWVPINVTVTRLHVRPKILGLITARDVREQQRAHAQLTEKDAELRRALDTALASEAKYRSLTESLEQSIFLKDRSLRFQAVNRCFCAGLGLGETDLLGKTDADLYPPELAAKYQADDRRVLTLGARLELEEQNLARGEIRTVRVIKTPVKDANDQVVGVLGIFWDVSEQRALEAQLRQSQKMEAIGQLAGGVAHDFNNLLTIIIGNTALLQRTLAPEDSRQELLQHLEIAAQRGAELTAKMLGFSRQTTLRLQPSNLNTSIEEAVALLARTIDPRIHLRAIPAADLWPVEADPGQINQLLMNLCLNARDAMPEGGALLLETENVVLGEDAVRLHLDARPGEHVCLRVKDTGTGIPADVLPRIFDPFFTTKAPGKGTGLGLAMVFGIVKQHQGWINCRSQVGGGTCFEIYLPRTRPARNAAADTNAAHQNGSPARGHETILIADDEPLVLNLGAMILKRYGYTVKVAKDGRQAVELYRQSLHSSAGNSASSANEAAAAGPQSLFAPVAAETAAGRIDLVILDLTMPGLSGRDAFRKLRQIDPAVRVLFASGFSADHIDREERDRVLGFVGKPYKIDDLVGAVRRALDRPREMPPAEALDKTGTADPAAEGFLATGLNWQGQSLLPPPESVP